MTATEIAKMVLVMVAGISLAYITPFFLVWVYVSLRRLIK